jgi:predicted short-subunit dehydrogenase-like oxidoreductase (DUF2520 family)
MSDLSSTQKLSVPPASSERTLIVGDGAVARALAMALDRAGAPVDRWWRKSGRKLPPGDVVVLAVRDESIGDAAAQVMAQLQGDDTLPILLHCAGAVPAEEPFQRLQRRPLGVGLVHPLKPFAGSAEDADLYGTVFAVQGDALGLDAALRLVRRVGGKPLELDKDALARYHAAAALVSNHAVGLVDAGVELLTGAGLERGEATRALAGLLAATARNLADVGLPDALTGPIARGDVEVIARHLLALRELRDIAALYRATGRRVTKVAADKGRAGRDALERIRALLGVATDGD